MESINFHKSKSLWMIILLALILVVATLYFLILDAPTSTTIIQEPSVSEPISGLKRNVPFVYF